MKKGIIFLIIVIPLLTLFYFGLTRDPRTLPSALIGRPAPDFLLETLDGKKVSLAASPGSPVLLNFWSTWCGPCLAEHELIRTAREAFEKKGVHFYSILYEDTPENAKTFIKQYGEGATILIDTNLKTAIDYGVSGVPETFFIDRQGVIRDKFAGPLPPDLLHDQLERLVGDPGNDDERVKRLGEKLRCPVCRGVPIADSPAALAVQMMEQLRGQIATGKSDEEILKYFEERYGEWVLLEPKREGINYLLWVLPLFFLGGGALFILRRSR